MAIPFASPTEDTVLALIQEAASGIKQPPPSTLNSSSRDVKNWITAGNRIGRQVRRKALWPCLNKRYTVTTSADTLTYALPPDFDRSVFDTFWQSGKFWQMIGPLTQREWENQKNGVVTAAPAIQFRFSGINSKNVELVEDPGVDAFVFQFQSLNWILPTLDWAAGVAVSAGEYCQYNGNVYKALEPGATGADAPVHQVGSASDGVINWEYVAYEKIVEDGARVLLDRDIFILGVQWAWLQINGFEYDAILGEFLTEIKKRVGALSGASSFVISNGQASPFFGWAVVPQTGWGE